MCAQHGAQEHVHVPCQLGATQEDGLLSLGLATTVTLLITAPGGRRLSLMTSLCLWKPLR